MTDPVQALNFVIYFGVAILLLAAFIAAYTLVTPVREFALIREGNTAVAVSFGGAVIGFALPLASAIAHSQTLASTVIAAAVALVAQLLCFAVLRLIRRDATAALIRGEMAEGVLTGALSVALGILNAACLT